jgi:hypothetical protein
MEKFNELKKLVDGMEDDFKKFYSKDNHAAGTRIRSGMQELKKRASEIRKEVQSIKKA